MFVLIDYEWVEKEGVVQYPTQLAAKRVEDDYTVTDSFYMTFKAPQDREIDFSHMAFGGRPKEMFLQGASAQEVFTAFKAWLKPDDNLFLWAHRSCMLFKREFKLMLNLSKFFTEIYCLRESVQPLLREEEYQIGTPEELCRMHGLDVLPPQHYSPVDIDVLLLLLKTLGADLKHIRRADLSPEEIEHHVILDHYHEFNPFFRPAYLYDPVGQLVHISTCPKLHDGMYVEGNNGLQHFARRRYKACECCKEIFSQFRADRLESLRNRTKTRYARENKTKILHYWDCPELANTHGYGVVAISRYEKGMANGGIACPVCNPQPESPKQAIPRTRPTPKADIPAPPPQPKLDPPAPETPEETAAMKRYTFLTAERKRLLANGFLSQQQKDDIFTLTQPQYAFWLASGYRNFHKRECPKLRGMMELKGFSTIGDALNGGNSPCKVCKPSKKDNIKIYIPLETQKREGENSDSLLALCKEKNLTASYSEPYLTFENEVSRWKMDLRRVPVILEHTPLSGKNAGKESHPLDERFLSFADAITFAETYDKNMSEQMKTGIDKINAFR